MSKLTLTIGRYRPISVTSHTSASRIYQAIRISSGEGASTFPDGKLSDGHHISYNGRVCFGDEVTQEAASLTPNLEVNIRNIVTDILTQYCGCDIPEEQTPRKILQLGCTNQIMSREWVRAKTLLCLWYRANRDEAFVSCKNIAKSIGVNIDYRAQRS